MAIVNKKLLTVLAFLVMVFSAQSQSGFTMETKSIEIDALLIELAAYFSKDISFHNSYFDNDLVDASFSNTPLDQCLKKILSSTDIQYKIFNDRIELKRYKTIYGYILDKLSGEKLINASVYLENSNLGVYSNEHGFFSFKVPFEVSQLSISYVGYTSEQISITESKNQQYEIYLEYDETIPEVIISNINIENDVHFELKGQELLEKDINTVVATGGEPDVFQYLYNLPGVNAGPDGLGGLHVRGGNVDQNLIMLDGIKIYNPSHSFGLFSIFNNDLLRSAEFKKSGFDPQNSGRLSSTLDMRLKDGNLKKWEANIGVSTLASSVALEGPLWKDKIGLIVSARRTHIDPVLESITEKRKDEEGLIGLNMHHFLDLNMKINIVASKKNRFYFSYYKGEDFYFDQSDIIFDDFDFEVEDLLNYEYEWGNELMALRWNYILNENWFSNLSVSYSEYDYESFNFSSVYSYDFIEDIEFDSLAITEFFSSISDLEVKWDLDYVPSEKYRAEFGMSYSNKNFAPGIFNYAYDVEVFQYDEEAYSELVSDQLDNAYNIKDYNLYFNNLIEVYDNTHLSFGGVGSYFKSEDLLFGDKSDYKLFQINAKLRQKLGRSISFAFSYDRSFQSIHLLSTANIGFPNDLWVPSTQNVSPSSSDQLDLSFIFNKGRFSFKSQLYYKKLYDILRYNYGSSLPSLYEIVSQLWETEVVSGKGESYGFENLGSIESDHYSLNFAYAYSQSKHLFPSISGTADFPFEFDQTHKLSLQLKLKIKKSLWLFANWNYATGLAQTLYLTEAPYSPFESLYPPPEDQLSEVNGTRLPAYHRLDAGIIFSNKSSKRDLNIILGVQNVMNRKNVYYRYFLQDDFFDPSENGLKDNNSLPLLPQIRFNIRIK